MHEAVGRTQTVSDLMDPARAAALHGVLGLAGDPPKRREALRPFAHQVYFWSIASAGELGPDGHPELGGFIPDLGLPTRMWAGGRLRFVNPLRTGLKAEKASTIEKVEHKKGRSGVLAFVTIRHEITQQGKLAVTEWQDLVYRAGNAKGAGRRLKAPSDPDKAVAVRFPETMLFRYSAITFNAHRIHYDADFCRRDLGLSGPVVHGPLLAQMLMLLAEDNLGSLRHFEFQATAPLMVGQSAELCWRADGSAWIRGSKGQLIMQAHAS